MRNQFPKIFLFLVTSFSLVILQASWVGLWENSYYFCIKCLVDVLAKKLINLLYSFLERLFNFWFDIFHRAQEIDQPALIPHIAEASSLKFPYEVLFRSLHKLLMDTATSEYFHHLVSSMCQIVAHLHSLAYWQFWHLCPQVSFLWWFLWGRIYVLWNICR